jgi:SAM-dependent methyltransferase
VTNPAERFGDRAQAYAAFRPSYPAEAIDAVLDGLGDPAQLEIVDVGAGTGIASRLFADRGAHVIAIEPSAAMRAEARDHPRIDWQAGTAEATGLPDGCAEVVVACQAFHWFATPSVMHEFRRIARCRSVILQYERDERDAFTKAYGDIVRKHARDDTEAMRVRAMGIFARFPRAAVRRLAFTSTQRFDRDGLIGRAASASYLPVTGPAAAALQRDLAAVFERFESGGQVELAIVTFVLVADFM